MVLEVPPPEVLPVAAPEAARLSPIATLVVLTISVGLAVSGQLVLKAAMDRLGPIAGAEIAAGGQTIARAIREPLLWAGLALFGLSAMFWLVVLSNIPLSLAYPFVGVSYVAIVLFSRFVLGEHVPALRWVGVITIALGIGLVGMSFRRLGA